MADKKISELTELTTPDGTEELVVNDSGVSKKVQIDNLIADNGLSGNKIDGGTISNFTSTGIDDNATSTAITIDASENVDFSEEIKLDTSKNMKFKANSSNSDSRYWKVRNDDSAYGDLGFKVSASNSDVSYSSVLELMSDGRGLSQFTAKAWVNFNGTGTVAINDSHNVSSITDSGVGYYYINFTNSLANANHATTATPRYLNGSGVALTSFWDNTGSTARTPLLVVAAVNAAWSPRDSALINAITFGD